MNSISSPHNDKIKYLRKLYRTRRRKRERKLVLEGYRIVREAIYLGAEPESLFVTEDFLDGKRGREIRGLIGDREKINIIDEDLISEITDTVNPQGIVAIVKEPDYDRETLKHKSDNILVLDGVQDPGNVGTLIRTALAAGFDGVVALRGTVDLYNLKVIRATTGALFNIPLFYNFSPEDLLKFKNAGFRVIGADTGGEHYHFQVQYEYPLLLVIGNEARGMSKEVEELADIRVKIPLLGNIDSLNAAVAGSILMYEVAVKKWQKKTSPGTD